MALYIVNKSGTEKIWHIGMKTPLELFFSNDNLRIIEQVAYIQADLDELEHIRNLFTSISQFKDVAIVCTIPMPRQRVVKWVGETAQTILLNL